MRIQLITSYIIDINVDDNSNGEKIGGKTNNDNSESDDGKETESENE